MQNKKKKIKRFKNKKYKNNIKQKNQHPNLFF